MSAGCHASPYSGNWYPDDAAQLQELLGRCRRESAERTGPFFLNNPLGFVVPHAGISYSGAVAYSVYRALAAARAKRVILLGFPHRGTPGGVCVPDITGYRTPLGEVPVERAVLEKLAADGAARMVRETLICDHSIELQLPFLQEALGGATLVPISVGEASGEELDKAATALVRLAGEGTVFVASSDFTHYGNAFRYRPFPPNAAVRDRLRELDDDLADGAGSLNRGLFLKTLKNRQSTLCGVHSIGLLIEVLNRLGGAIYQQGLDYQTSGEKTGDYEHSVSYRALGYYRKQSFAMSEETGRALLDSSFRTLRRTVEGGRRDRPHTDEVPVEQQARLGAFVTLYADGRLRGCIGSCFQPRPLVEAIPDLTVAATEDDRFPPIRARELDSLEVEISVLTPFRRIVQQEQWEPGVHGALLRTGERRGLLLPQVAVERKWDSDAFFDALARKAGCTPDVYSQPDTRIFVFESHSCRGRYTGGE